MNRQRVKRVRSETGPRHSCQTAIIQYADRRSPAQQQRADIVDPGTGDFGDGFSVVRFQRCGRIGFGIDIERGVFKRDEVPQPAL
jgi:hypothetical protein